MEDKGVNENSKDYCLCRPYNNNKSYAFCVIFINSNLLVLSILIQIFIMMIQRRRHYCFLPTYGHCNQVVRLQYQDLNGFSKSVCTNIHNSWCNKIIGRGQRRKNSKFLKSICFPKNLEVTPSRSYRITSKFLEKKYTTVFDKMRSEKWVFFWVMSP